MAHNTYAPSENPYAVFSPYFSTIREYGPKDYLQWRNPYSGNVFQNPQDELEKAYYTKNPNEANSLYARAFGGSAGGNLEAFIRKAMADHWADYTKANQTQPELMYTDTLTPDFAKRQWDQWQSQTPYEKGENANLFAGAGRRV